MANGQMNAVLRHVRRDGGGLTDGQLLERFLAARDEAAFEALLRRHGPMVLGVCRRVLAGADGGFDAEDAFQATFLVLVHKAASVTARESVGSWLYGVAYRTARKARASAARRRAKERQMARPEAVLEHDAGRELRALIDQELSRLPEKYREPIILCDLEGRTREEAARRLGCPEGTVSGRLARARVLLARRLARHGLPLVGATVAHALAVNAASAHVPVSLVGSTVKAAALVAAGQAASGGVSAAVAALTQGVLQTMCVSKIKWGLAVALAVGLLGAGWGVYRTRAGDGPAKGADGQAVPAGGPVKGQAGLNLPMTDFPVQVLASINRDGKLVIKTVVHFGVDGRQPAVPVNPAVPVPALPANPGGPAPNVNPPDLPPGVPVPAIAPGAMPGWGLHSMTFNLDDVVILDTRAKRVDKETVRKRLRTETVALASLWGQKVDPLHLRVIREGTLIFVLPAPRGVPGAGPPGTGIPGALPPQAVPGVGPGGVGAAPTGVGVAPPGNVVPSLGGAPPSPRP